MADEYDEQSFEDPEAAGYSADFDSSEPSAKASKEVTASYTDFESEHPSKASKESKEESGDAPAKAVRVAPGEEATGEESGSYESGEFDTAGDLEADATVNSLFSDAPPDDAAAPQESGDAPAEAVRVAPGEEPTGGESGSHDSGNFDTAGDLEADATVNSLFSDAPPDDAAAPQESGDASAEAVRVAPGEEPTAGESGSHDSDNFGTAGDLEADATVIQAQLVANADAAPQTFEDWVKQENEQEEDATLLLVLEDVDKVEAPISEMQKSASTPAMSQLTSEMQKSLASPQPGGRRPPRNSRVTYGHRQPSGRAQSSSGASRQPRRNLLYKDWDERFHHVGGENEMLPQGKRQYFSKPMPTPDKKDDPIKVLKSSIGGVQTTTTPGRHLIGGQMLDRDGKERPWNNRWSEGTHTVGEHFHVGSRPTFGKGAGLFDQAPSQRWRRHMDVEIAPGVWKPNADVKKPRFGPMGG